VTRDRELEPRAERSAGPGRVEVWHGPDRQWRYRYVHSPRGTVIESNRSFITRDEAVTAGRIAYPGVPVVERHKPPEGERPRRSSLRRLFAKAWFLAGSAIAIRGLVRVVLRGRRAVRKARRLAGLASVVAALARREAPPEQDDAPGR
jgi:quinol---cytochrome-c reductase cytochrome b subunit